MIHGDRSYSVLQIQHELATGTNIPAGDIESNKEVGIGEDEEPECAKIRVKRESRVQYDLLIGNFGLSAKNNE